MKINQCQFCDSKNIRRERYLGASFWIFVVLSLGLYFVTTAFMPVTVFCRDCNTEYIAS